MAHAPSDVLSLCFVFKVLNTSVVYRWAELDGGHARTVSTVLTSIKLQQEFIMLAV